MGDLVRYWYAGLFLFASAYTLYEEGHVRVDILYQGLKNKDKKFAEIIRKKTINLIEKKKFREYYSCKSGLGMGAKNFSWTAALYLDFKLNSY